MVDKDIKSATRKSRKRKTPTDLLRSAALGASSASASTTSAVFRRILVQNSDRLRQEPETEEVFDVISVDSDAQSVISISSDASSTDANASAIGMTKKPRKRASNAATKQAPEGSRMSGKSRKVPVEYLEMVNEVVNQPISDTELPVSKLKRRGQRSQSSDYSRSPESEGPVQKRSRQVWNGQGKGKGRADVVDLESDAPSDDNKLQPLTLTTDTGMTPSSVAGLETEVRDPESDMYSGTDKRGETTPGDSDGSDEEDADESEWEDVDMGAVSMGASITTETLPVPEERKTVEFTIGESKPVRSARKKTTITREDREFRLTCHMFHLVCLICHGSIRSQWCNDASLKASLSQYVPDSIEDELHPEPTLPIAQRTRKFLDGLRHLMDFWNKRFRVIYGGMRRHQWEEIEAMSKAPNQEPPLDLPQFRRTLNSLEGSRDLGAQGFCALLRSFRVRTRLVFSMQPLPFSFASKGAPKPNRSSKAIVAEDEDDQQASTSNTSSPAPLKRPPVRLRKPRFSTSKVSYGMADHVAVGLDEAPYPIFWVEAWDEAGLQWVSIDPMVLKLVEIAKYRSKFEPPASETANVMSYVMAFDQAGHAKDVTRRYAHQYNSKTRKLRITNEPVWTIWFDRVMRVFQTKYLTDIDQMEDAALLRKEASEELPSNIQDFKGHPIFVLERHLRQNEIISPKVPCGTVAVGRAKNSETVPVYRRRDVKALRSAPQWYRVGRKVKLGEQALKHVKRRAPRSKALMSDNDDDEEEDSDEVALYADYQTELYVPPPVVNGKIPKNDYGNLDVFVPSMVPKGGVHLRFRGIANAARLLGIDYADAVGGFDFQARKATPRLDGIVVAEEYVETVTAVYNAQQEQLQFEEDARRQQDAMRRWRKYLIALRVRDRLASNPVFKQLEEEEQAQQKMAEVDKALENEEAGGFIVSEQDVAADGDTTGFTRETDENESDDGGGGFLEEDDAGGFMVDSQSDAGGFMDEQDKEGFIERPERGSVERYSSPLLRRDGSEEIYYPEQ